MHRLLRRPALAIDGDAGDVVGQPGGEPAGARDVAGLIRSIDYSTTAALERALNVARDGQGKLTAALAAWRDRACAAFLESYRDAMSDARLWPADDAAAGRVLDVFLLEKALYEIEYEIAHRPEWIRVPLAGVLRILADIAGDSP